MSPYNTRSPKKTLTSSDDKPAHSTAYETIENSSPPPLLTSSYTPPTLNGDEEKAKLLRIGSSLQKKAQVFLLRRAEPPDQTPNITPGFNLGIFEKTPARALFKAARKGKSKMVSAANETADSSERKGGCAKPLQQQ
jgi:hypothetical protein